MKLNFEQVKAYIPHREPFLFVDSIESLEYEGEGPFSCLKDLIGGVVEANFSVKEDLEILRGHFPGNPVLPGVVQVEMMAQASIFITFELFEDPYNVDLEVALLGVKDSKFRKPVVPGMELKIKSKMIKARGQIMSFEAEISSGDEIVSQASFLASFSQRN
ncbi:MAG: beta-hydroxyacyl-ACP dehydratase [Bacteriovoracaceae bacterium]|jgi:3-hydroxyacyl-[acyl-carrier-protein] dehydratase|nr:beta-hydroxyacyl-ACP dehydratase [Bacteriovoracaceae bacterium]